MGDRNFRRAAAAVALLLAGAGTVGIAGINAMQERSYVSDGERV
jgi:hypothetical protein